MDYELVSQSVCAFAERTAEKLREDLLDRIWLPNVKVSKSGILLGEFSPLGQVQLNLFESGHAFRKSSELMQMID